MLIRNANRLPAFTAVDECRIVEILNPERDGSDPNLSLAQAEVKPGGETVPHVLAFTEIYHVLSGQGRMHLGRESAPVGPGDTVYIPSGTEQWIENSGPEPLKFLCICHPAYDRDGDRRV